VRRELHESPALVLGQEHKLQQVFLNLFLNARDAMPKGGWLSVSTGVTGARSWRKCPTRALVFRASTSPVSTTLLHDQGHRSRDGPRPVNHLRHRARARWRDRLRQRDRQGTKFSLSFPAVQAERLCSPVRVSEAGGNATQWLDSGRRRRRNHA
jgi:hypothetical protein